MQKNERVCFGVVCCEWYYMSHKSIQLLNHTSGKDTNQGMSI